MAFKTNVMRLLDQKKIPYDDYSYTHTDAISGIDVAEVLGQNPARVFKTLVTVSKTGQHYVFVIPVQKELDLKLAAASVGEKSVRMLPAKELLPLTGYVHGGCSPIGMKKNFRTILDVSAQAFDRIIFSAGKVGYQVKIALTDLAKVVLFTLAAISMA
ncbi:Cys-tRNA(Pro) deacylase [Terribacillus sp. DMT04]|uniref:Cys-tRNA(Pro) deacylase n=1 Tax=Terribacillus sp. DMT04 TaxID=2850441 RepID=UPI001C2CA3DA|nr:Cys-tRNA(Pro) deacylase [Terribacillus sp. DMT04]QXE02264.1 Cys-tRNA(Pro) deacylase [Terribacillus sp. DMT04]